MANLKKEVAKNKIVTNNKKSPLMLKGFFYLKSF
jgi:hypothetical protein